MNAASIGLMFFTACSVASALLDVRQTSELLAQLTQEIHERPGKCVMGA